MKLLVTLDGSSLSEAVLDHVLPLAVQAQAQVILLTVGRLGPEFGPDVQSSRRRMPSTPGSGAMPEGFLRPEEVRPVETHDQLYARRRDELLRYLSPHVHALREHGVDAVAEVKLGDPAQCIIDFARTAGVDLIAMATHGRTGVARLVLGSVAEKIVRSGVAPVLLVRPEGALGAAQS